MELIYDYIVSLVNLYGIVHKEKVLEIYNEQNNKPSEIATIDEIMRNDAEMLKENFVFIEGSYFVHEAIILFDDINDVLAERIGKPFYVPRKNELLKYKDQFYFEKTLQYKRMFRYVTKHLVDGNREKAKELCEEIQLMCQQENSVGEIFNLLNNFDIDFESEQEVGEMLNLVSDLKNHTRLWANNGHMPSELFNVERKHLTRLDSEATLTAEKKAKQRKVGRNDPCPCGSGKKYKKCCLT